LQPIHSLEYVAGHWSMAPAFREMTFDRLVGSKAMTALIPIAWFLVIQISAQPPAPPPAAPGNPVVVISTSAGDMTLELFKDRAPVSVQNFLQYAADGFYTGTIFHRVIPNFMIQGGGFEAGMIEKSTRPPILNEATNGLSNVRGTVGMARTRALRSATAQFYINVADNRSKLDHRGYGPEDFGYAVFGRVLNGMDIVDRIAATPTRTLGPHADVPVEDVVITGVKLQKAGPSTKPAKVPPPAATRGR
jgi:cyclophilin family peptidyl-prolyl cis-trans isomerase